MKVFINYTLTNDILIYEIKQGKTVKSIVNYVKRKFGLGSHQVGDSEQKLILVYSGSELHEDWILSDLNITPGSTIKCIFKEEKIPDYYVHIKFQKSILRFYDYDWELISYTVFKLRILLSEEIGLPLSTFRLKSHETDTELFDERRLVDYGIERHDHIILETWLGWDLFLNNCIKGYTKQVLKHMSSDELIRQYQSKVALYIAAHYGHIDLANNLISSGARPDRPVGEHPCRQWCLPQQLRPEYLRCAIHEAIIHGQLKMVSLLYNLGSSILEEKDGFGIPPWRLSLRNYHRDPIKNFKQKEVARFVLSKQFGAKFKLTEKCSVSTIFYFNLKGWIERSRERVLLLQGIGKSTLRKRPFHKGGLLGYKTLVDGFNNNFKEQINSYEALRQKYKYYYFYSEEDKMKFKNPEVYFRTLNTVNAFNLLKPVAKFNRMIDSNTSNLKTTNHKKLPAIQVTNAEATKMTHVQMTRARLRWKNLINKQINLIIITKYAEILRNMGYEVEVDKDYEAMMRKVSDQSKQSLKADRSNFLKSIKMQMAREEGELMSIKHENQHSKQRFLKPIESKDTKSLTRSHKYMDSSMSVIIPSKEAANEVIHYNPLNHLNNMMKSSMSDGLSKTSRPHESSFKSRSLEFEANVMNEYLKYCNGQTPRMNAIKCLNDASEFKTKTWIQQFNISTTMIRQKFKRRIDLKLNKI